MTEEKDQKTTTDESKKTEEKSEEHMIPKTRFDEVNNRAKEAEARLAQLETEKAEADKKALEESGKFKELYESTKAEAEKLRIEGTRRDLIQEAIINNKLLPKLSKMVTGSTEEEIKKSLEEAITLTTELNEQIKNDKTANDNAGGAGQKGQPMSTEEWMRLYEKDPAEADRVLKEAMNAK